VLGYEVVSPTWFLYTSVLTFTHCFLYYNTRPILALTSRPVMTLFVTGVMATWWVLFYWVHRSTFSNDKPFLLYWFVCERSLFCQRNRMKFEKGNDIRWLSQSLCLNAVVTNYNLRCFHCADIRRPLVSYSSKYHWWFLRLFFLCHTDVLSHSVFALFSQKQLDPRTNPKPPPHTHAYPDTQPLQVNRTPVGHWLMSEVCMLIDAGLDQPSVVKSVIALPDIVNWKYLVFY